jgi:hypothetical protein
MHGSSKFSAPKQLASQNKRAAHEIVTAYV